VDPQPLGAYLPTTTPALAIACAALAVAAAALLLELSRTLAERARGRWYAGNGRDVFHVAAAVALALALFVAGHPPALCGFAAAAVCSPGLLALDGLPARRRTRVGLLLALFARTPRRLVVSLWCATFLVAGPSLLYYANGGAQFGMRHALDFEPFLFVLLAIAATQLRWRRHLVAR